MSELISIEVRTTGSDGVLAAWPSHLLAGAGQFKGWLPRCGREFRFDGDSSFGSFRSRTSHSRQPREHVLTPGLARVLAMTERPDCGQDPTILHGV